MVLDIILLSFGILLQILGLLGGILPVIPGPPLSYAGIILLHFTSYADFSGKFLIIFGVLAALITILDYFLPVWGTKKFGGSSRGVWGATIGLVLGLLFFPPIGIVVGPFVGALVGEMTRGGEFLASLKSAFGSFVGFLLGTGMKLAVSGVMAYYFARELFV